MDNKKNEEYLIDDVQEDIYDSFDEQEYDELGEACY